MGDVFQTSLGAKVIGSRWRARWPLRPGKERFNFVDSGNRCVLSDTGQFNEVAGQVVGGTSAHSSVRAIRDDVDGLLQQGR